jgi:hypothetical protein
MPAGVLACRGVLQTIGWSVRRYTPTARRLAARTPGRSSGTRISLLCVAAQDRVLAELTDPDGRSVVLLARIWENKITREHPELRDHLDQVVGTVAEPDHAEPDPRAQRRRYYRRRVGPSRWLLVVVSFEQRPGRIITAVATRKDPRQWKP